MNQFAACLLLATFVAYGSASPFTDCGCSTGQVSSVQVDGCPDGQTECALKRGSQPTITIQFTSKAATNTLKTVVHGIIAKVPVPFPVPQPDACKAGVSCPVSSGQSYTYSNKFNVRNAYPPIGVTVRFELKDDKGSDMVCVEIPCKIQ